MLKKILRAIAIWAGLFWIASFVPQKFTISASETINKPQKVVFDYMKILKNQDQYVEWIKNDSTLKREIIGTDGTVGAKQHWISKEDEGEQQIIVLSEDRIDMEMRSIRPTQDTIKSSNIFKAVSENQTLLTYTYDVEEDFPNNIPFYLLGGKTANDTLAAEYVKKVKKIVEAQK